MTNTIRFPLGEAGELRIPRDEVISRLLAGMGAQHSGIPRIGEYWPGQGGVNAGLMRGENGAPDEWLIATTNKAADLGELEYGSPGEDEPGAKSHCDGRDNTIALWGESPHSHPAAEACAKLIIEGHSDFYLPAIRELRLLHAFVPELFDTEWYWSSTQYSAHFAWVQSFGGGYQIGNRKGGKGRVRAVRRVSDLTL